MNPTSLNRTVRAVGSLGLAACMALGAMLAHGAERGPARKPAAATSAVETEARVIVKYKADSTMMRALAAQATHAGPQHAQALSARLGMALRDGRELGPRSQLVFASGMSSSALAATLSAQADVEYAVVDGRQRALAAPNDPLYPGGQAATTPTAGQWYLRAPDATIVAAINAVSAWDVTTGHSSIVVAVLDTGIRPEHPDLQGKILPGYDFIHDIPTANDGDARDADPSDPGDGVSQADIDNKVPGCKTSDIGPSSWHGTQTAGLIGAATNNGVGMASVGRDIRVLPLRVLGKCGGYDSDIMDAMRWAAGIAVAGVPANPNPAKVVNMSLGSTGACSASYQDVVNQLTAAGVLVVAAAGNDGLAVGTPANCSGVLAVAGLRHTGTKVGYSDLGPEVGIAAPAGNCVTTTGTCLFPLLTTANSGTAGPLASIYTDGNNPSIGTSFSSPLVAGTAALMLSANRSLTPTQLIAALKSSARAFPTSGAVAGTTACKAPSSTAQTAECYCTTSTCGAGMLDASAAVAAVAKLTANVYAPVSPTVGSGITLDGTGSVATAAQPIVSYQWAIVSGAGTAAFTSATNVPTATLVASAAGSVTVSLTVTNSANVSDTTTATLAVTDASVAPPAAGGGGGGGGGAFDPLWLAGVLLAALVLSWSRRSPSRLRCARIRQSPSRARRSSGR